MNHRSGAATEAGNAPQSPGQTYRGSARQEVMRLLPPLPPGCKVLEIGCGEGAFSMALANSAETWGVEPDRPSAEIAERRLHKVFPNTFDEIKAQLPHRYFDLIVCNDVIEHMADHDKFLLSIQDHMSKNSHIVGSIPNVRFYPNLFNLIAARDWHYHDSGILDRTHLRFFTFRSIRRSLEVAGFEVKLLEGLNAARPSGWGIRALAERLFRASLIILSCGAARDINFMQIGFLATPAARSASLTERP